MLYATDGPPAWALRLAAWGAELVKRASADDPPEVAYALAGTLYLASNGWLLLSVPNALARGAFQALAEPGVELPPPGPDGRFNAHISVAKPAEVAALGGAEKITERGKQFRYTLGRLYSVEPAGWPQYSRVWFVRVHSPELQALRRSYGLSGLPGDGRRDFHITVAVRRRGVLGRNEANKADATAAAPAA